jgi:DNA-binding IclR family transcriptional regulator
MNEILLVLLAAPQPLRPSEVAEKVGRPTQYVRRSLATLERNGLAAKKRVGNRGPIGTYAWGVTKKGAESVQKFVELAKGIGNANH